MLDIQLFQDEDNFLTKGDFVDALKMVGAHDSDVLYVHAGLSFGSRPMGISRNALLGELVDSLVCLGPDTVCFPTYTFSFCNDEEYDPLRSKTRMGALNDFFRQCPRVSRSLDPLLSFAVHGERIDSTLLDHDSLGPNSHYGQLDESPGVKFVFLGVDLASCFTYMHYLEALAGVDYRYYEKFTGEIILAGRRHSTHQSLFLRYSGVEAGDGTKVYENFLKEEGYLRSVKFGRGVISCIALEPARKVYLDMLSRDKYFFINGSFDSTCAKKPAALESPMLSL